MKQFETWFSNCSLNTNTDKTKEMLFHFNKTSYLVMTKIEFTNVELSYSSEVKFLGMNISNNLKWNIHIPFLCSKLNKVSYMITTLRGDLSFFMLRNTHILQNFNLLYSMLQFYGVGKERVERY